MTQSLRTQTTTPYGAFQARTTVWIPAPAGYYQLGGGIYCWTKSRLVTR